MDAASLIAFNKLAQASDEALEVGPELAPAVVNISGVDYGAEGGVAAVKGDLRWTMRDGGFSRIQELFVSIDKAIMADPPAKDAVLIFAGAEFLDPVIDGDNTTDTAWQITATRTPK